MQNSPFTIKWILEDGATTLFPAAAVTTVPAETSDDPDQKPPHGIAMPPVRLEFDSGDGRGVRSSIDRGTVYVMNQNGKTVDTFHLPIAS
ncbi:hypothetical protein DVVG_00016 [Dunaliella viridis virus SI2]|uniref:hypothetical protein n=1 Tax=Dunaliella viridis virus SI2 TaxID=754069 RepID=UPI0002C0A0A8|nr:hypothetical protein DVVG_00016 [Dunaliella viridis virus SI2]AGH16002.1 hypothetical protein DVVG_00016 [Dunaliella viridis virus SI2]